VESENQKALVYILLGPTASGKSAVALEVAERIGAEIISIDSMQVYRGMDVGTAKPPAAERARVPHHLIDLREPWESFSTAEYIAAADAAVREITARGHKPLFVGGTALYIKSLLVGIFEGPSADWELRNRLRDEAARTGVEALHARLGAIDPEAAARIHPNDLRRIERSLEIFEKTGIKPSALRHEWASGKLRYDARVAGLDVPREELYARINARVDEMVADGWLDEISRLVADSRGLGREASQALGYNELARVVAGDATLEYAVEEIRTHTRQFAKRQMTWFRSFPNVCWVDASMRGAREGPVRVREIADKVIECFGIAGKTNQG
jgi:tRNA dimethylallyltransferase